MNELQIFNNPEFGDIRCIEVNGEPWMVGKDVAAALGYSNPQKAIRDHVDAEDKTVNDSFTVNGTQVILINESGLYSLVLSSKLPGARKFRRWVTDEVIPSIRKHGAYITPDTLEKMIASPEFGIKLLTALKEEREKRLALEAKVEADASKVAFANAVEETPAAVTVEKFAKATYTTFGLGRNKMFRRLRAEGFLTDQNIPAQRYIDLGWFDVCEVMKYGKPYFVTLITGVGQQKLFAALAG